MRQAAIPKTPRRAGHPARRGLSSSIDLQINLDAEVEEATDDALLRPGGVVVGARARVVGGIERRQLVERVQDRPGDGDVVVDRVTAGQVEEGGCPDPAAGRE